MVSQTKPRRIAVLTSGGDAQGMNAAVRAVTRTGVRFGAEVFAIREGFHGLVEGGDYITQLGWDDVGGIQHRGGTVIGTARSALFRERAGLRRAALNLVRVGIDRIVVIGGDGSLAGVDELSQLWGGLLDELVQAGDLPRDLADEHPALMVTGIVGSIDNDMVGTDMTIGADSALHRIVEAIDALASTAASHQRSFVVEVMGRHCGYLALAAAIAGGCDYAFIPENPPPDGWEDALCEALEFGRSLGGRSSIVLVAEGARDRQGNPITADMVRDVIAEKRGDDARVTILGHVQRGGAPGAFDRSMATMMGYAAVQELLSAQAHQEGQLIALRHNRVWVGPLMRMVTQNRAIATLVDSGQYDAAMKARGASFTNLHQIQAALAQPKPEESRAQPTRIAILHGGGLAPGMNTAMRAAVRLGHDAGHTMLGVTGGFGGLRTGRVRELTLRDAEGLVGEGGAELGSRRGVVPLDHLYDISREIERYGIDALLVIGGFDAYESVHRLWTERDRYPALRIPMVCLPASIDNNLPATELSIGANTALDLIVESVDRVKQSAMAARRVFVIETMGRNCGYLALMSALATGAEQVYLPEEDLTLDLLNQDVGQINARFAEGRRLFLVVNGEGADPHYTTDVIAQVFEAEGNGVFDVRKVVLGHIQQGGDPTPFDRILATRMAARSIEAIGELFAGKGDEALMIGLQRGDLDATPITRMPELVEWEQRRPKHQWWLGLTRIVRDLVAPPA